MCSIHLLAKKVLHYKKIVEILQHQLFMYLIHFTYTLLYRTFYIFLKKKKEVRWGTAYLKQLEQQFDGKFDDRTFNKIIFYYSLKVPAICDAFLHLYNTTTQRDECERLIHYFICSSVFDNFFDREELTDEEIYNITFNSKNWQSKNFNERIALHSHLLLIDFVKNKEEYFEILKKEYDVQVLSRHQFEATISNEEIKKITVEKGGNAVLLTSYYLNHQATEQEKVVWYKLGCVIQFVNDLFDIYRDLQNGLQTIPNRLTTIDEFKNYYLSLVQDVKKSIQNIDVKKSRKLVLKISAMGICALGIIAVEQLEKLQAQHNHNLSLKTLPRKDLIVDMEKMTNLWKWVKVVYKLSK